MTYDHWKTTDDTPEEEWGECDVCERRYPLRKLGTLWAYGIETFACDDCADREPDEDEAA